MILIGTLKIERGYVIKPKKTLEVYQTLSPLAGGVWVRDYTTLLQLATILDVRTDHRYLLHHKTTGCQATGVQYQDVQIVLTSPVVKDCHFIHFLMTTHTGPLLRRWLIKMHLSPNSISKHSRMISPNVDEVSRPCCYSYHRFDSCCRLVAFSIATMSSKEGVNIVTIISQWLNISLTLPLCSKDCRNNCTSLVEVC